MEPQLIGRRAAIKEMGRAGLAVVVFGVTACSDSSGTVSTVTAPGVTTTVASIETSTTGATDPTTSTSSTTATTASGPATGFQRVDLGFVSAYILYRGGEAALVDTGVEGSGDDIEAALGQVGLTWDAVGHVILTHKHPDHAGSIDDVLGRAPGADVYAGAPDIPSIVSATLPQPVADGDTVFDLQVIETPGHTPGHVSVLDAAAGILVTGDALNGGEGGVAGPEPAFTENMTVALDSVRKLAGYTYEVALFGHGAPLLEGASTAVAALAEG